MHVHCARIYPTEQNPVLAALRHVVTMQIAPTALLWYHRVTLLNPQPSLARMLSTQNQW